MITKFMSSFIFSAGVIGTQRPSHLRNIFLTIGGISVYSLAFPGDNSALLAAADPKERLVPALHQSNV